jgi:hypothetical protein
LVFFYLTYFLIYATIFTESKLVVKDGGYVAYVAIIKRRKVKGGAVKNLVFLTGFAVGFGLVHWLGRPLRLETDEDERMIILSEDPGIVRFPGLRRVAVVQ